MRLVQRLFCIFLMVAGWGLGGQWLLAQPDLDRAAMNSAVRRGVEALEQGRSAQAIAFLQPVVQQQSAYVADQHGTAAYWLGRAYQALELPDDALLAWSEGLGALQQQGRFDAALADAFVREAHRQKRRPFYPLAAGAYEQLLRLTGPDMTPASARVVEDDLQALALVMPDTVRQALRLPLPGQPLDPEAMPADVGGRLVAWWRAQDPLPATPPNERLHEHLERVAHAYDRYAPDGQLEDRGRIYIRLGEPSKTTLITFDDPEFRRKVLERNPNVYAAEFRPAEFWVYRQVDDATHYLFIEDDEGRYRIGHPDEVVPRTLRLGHGPGPRGYRKASAYIWSMEQVYKQLSVLHGDYSQRYTDIADQATVLNHQEIAGGMAVSIGDLPPHAYASSFSSEAEFEDEQLDDRREAATPAAYTAALDDALPLPVQLRTARFLDDDGTTRTELYWSAPADVAEPLGRGTRRDFGLPSEAGQSHYLMDVTLVQLDEAYRRQRVQEAQEAIDVREADGRGVLTPHTVAVEGATGTYYLAAQWDQFAAVTDEETGQPFRRLPRVRLHSWHSGAMHALGADPSTLEMSDLKPVRLPETAPLTPEAADSLGVPFPHQRLAADEELVLYFEVYHLAYGADDRTHYRIRYEVEQQDGAPPALLRLWQEPDAPTRTAATTSFVGTERTVREMLLMDLEEVPPEGTVTVKVVVTDETTGQTAERAMTFELDEAALRPAP